jgi:flagellar basal-body rod modification protein FlgD
MSISAIGGSTDLSALFGTTSKTAASSAATTSSAAGTSTTTPLQSGLGEMDFLNLLITQLKNQNPLDPMKDTEFIAQLASFSSLQQMTSMNTNFSAFSQQQNYMSAISMIGKQVTTSDGLTGVVSKVSNNGGTVNLYVGSNTYTLSDVINVSNVSI